MRTSHEPQGFRPPGNRKPLPSVHATLGIVVGCPLAVLERPRCTFLSRALRAILSKQRQEAQSTHNQNRLQRFRLEHIARGHDTHSMRATARTQPRGSQPMAYHKGRCVLSCNTAAKAACACWTTYNLHAGSTQTKLTYAPPRPP